MKSLILTLSLCATLTTFAGEPDRALAKSNFLSTEITQSSDKELLLRFNNPLSRELEIAIRTENDLLVYSKNYGTNSNYNGRFNLESLPAGQYQFQVYMDGQLVEEQNFTSNTTLDNEGSLSMVDIDLTKGNEKEELLLNVHNPLHKDLSFEIKDEKGKVVHQEDISDDIKVKQMLKTELLSPGTYSIEIWSGTLRIWHMNFVQS